MTRFKCWWHGHKFHKVGRSKVGLTIEKYVECKHCAKVVIMINIHPRYKIIHDYIDLEIAKILPKTLYFERKLLLKRSDKRLLYK